MLCSIWRRTVFIFQWEILRMPTNTIVNSFCNEFHFLHETHIIVMLRLQFNKWCASVQIASDLPSWIKQKVMPQKVVSLNYFSSSLIDFCFFVRLLIIVILIRILKFSNKLGVVESNNLLGLCRSSICSGYLHSIDRTSMKIIQNILPGINNSMILE